MIHCYSHLIQLPLLIQTLLLSSMDHVNRFHIILVSLFQSLFFPLHAWYFCQLCELKWSEVKISQSCLTFWDLMGYTVHGILQARIQEWIAFPFSRGFSHPRVEPRSPALQVDSLPAEPPGKPKNTGVGRLSLLQQIFLTQDSNLGLLHYRQILYQLSYEGSPMPVILLLIFSKFSLNLILLLEISLSLYCLKNRF